MRWIAAALVAGPAAAQVTLGDHPVLDTRFGRLEAGPAEYGQQLYFNGAPLADINDARVTMLGAWAIEGEAWDWVLVQIAHNGNMCPDRLVILRVSADALARTGEFAECLAEVEDVAITPGRIMVRVRDPAAAVEAQEFAFDGTAFTVTAVAAAAGAPAGAGGDALRWVGHWFGELVEDASERARFGAILTPDQIEDLRRRAVVGGGAEQAGDWVVGHGCKAHECNVQAGLWAIRVSDGRPAAAFFDEGGGETWFGVDPRTPEAAALLAPAAQARLP